MPTKIEWTHLPGTTGEMWSPVTGCSPISEGCKNCWARRMARRLAGRFGYPEAPHHFDVTLHPDRLDIPLRWRKPRTVFVCSMGDLFHESVKFEFIHQVFDVMQQSGNHTFLVLTKRPKRMWAFLEVYRDWPGRDWPYRNVWLGVSAENQDAADKRIPLLLESPAAVRFVSLEPLLGPISLSWWIPSIQERSLGFLGDLHPFFRKESDCLSWIIAGGESGPGARPMHPDWVRLLRDQAVAAGIPFFLKQNGEYLLAADSPGEKDGSDWVDCQGSWFRRVGKKAAGRELDGRTWDEFPQRQDRLI